MEQVDPVPALQMANIPDSTVSTQPRWLYEHFNDPPPRLVEQFSLAQEATFTVTQVMYWWNVKSKRRLPKMISHDDCSAPANRGRHVHSFKPSKRTTVRDVPDVTSPPGCGKTLLAKAIAKYIPSISEKVWSKNALFKPSKWLTCIWGVYREIFQTML